MGCLWSSEKKLVGRPSRAPGRSGPAPRRSLRSRWPWPVWKKRFLRVFPIFCFSTLRSRALLFFFFHICSFGSGLKLLFGPFFSPGSVELSREVGLMDDLGEKEGKQEGESELEREGKLMVVLSLALTMLIDRSIWCFQAPPPPLHTFAPQTRALSAFAHPGLEERARGGPLRSDRFRRKGLKARRRGEEERKRRERAKRKRASLCLTRKKKNSFND